MDDEQEKAKAAAGGASSEETGQTESLGQTPSGSAAAQPAPEVVKNPQPPAPLTKTNGQQGP
jgi:hypothetical protein